MCHVQIVYTLFLKEIGLSVDEALRFWSGEYCKPGGDHASNHSCQHSWHKHCSQYTYSINHLYGLVGRHASYRSYSCEAIQVLHPADELTLYLTKIFHF